MRGKPRPSLVRDHINYEVMDANAWRHASSLQAMGVPRRFCMTGQKVSRRYYLLSTHAPARRDALTQRVDLADRKTSNNDSYPFPIITKKPDLSNGYVFVTQPFLKAVDISGFDGMVRAIVNKRDVDVGLVLL